MSNPFTYNELHTTNPARAKEFYGKLFDWKINDIETPMGTYSEISTKDGPKGGLLKTGSQGAQWVAYVKVDDVASATAKAKTLGATAIHELQEVPNEGRFSLLTDPTGALFGLWESKKR